MEKNEIKLVSNNALYFPLDFIQGFIKENFKGGMTFGLFLYLILGVVSAENPFSQSYAESKEAEPLLPTSLKSSFL